MKEKNGLGRLSVPVKIVLSAVQEHEQETSQGHNHGQKLPLSEKFNSDGIHLKDKTKPDLKPDAKIRRMTGSNF